MRFKWYLSLRDSNRYTIKIDEFEKLTSANCGLGSHRIDYDNSGRV